MPFSAGGPVPDAGRVIDLGDAGQLDSGALGVGDAGLPLNAACAVINLARCASMQRCGLLEPTSQALATCLTFYEKTWCGQSTWISRVKASLPTLRYDAVRGEACAEAFDQHSCDAWQTEPEVCQRMLVPNVSQGQRCYGAYQECTDSVCRGEGCPKTCRALGGLGEICSVNRDCRPPGYCRPSKFSPGVGVCAEYSALNEICDSTDECTAGLICVLGVCAPRPTTGARCINSMCDDSSYCAAIGDGGVCFGRADAGTQCTASTQCRLGHLCIHGLCQLEQVGIAEPCTPLQRCPDNTVCALSDTVMGTGRCEAPKRLGSLCGWSGECVPSLACRDVDGGFRCSERAPAGSPCLQDRDCDVFSSCVENACLPRSAPGGLCGARRPCLFGACVEGDDGGVCVSAGPPGTRCDGGASCASGVCLAERCAAACAP